MPPARAWAPLHPPTGGLRGVNSDTLTLPSRQSRVGCAISLNPATLLYPAFGGTKGAGQAAATLRYAGQAVKSPFFKEGGQGG